MAPIHRRQLLIGSAAAAAGWLAVGCGETDDVETGENAAPTTAAVTTHLLGAVFPRGEAYVLAGVANRLPFVIAEADGAPLDRLDGPVTLTVKKGDTDLGEIPTKLRSTGLARAFVAAEWTPPAPGFYEVTATYLGEGLPPVVLQAFDAAETAFPQIGAALPVVTTPTTTNAAGVDPICTADPPCPLHSVDLATRPAGRPAAVLVSTPAFCQTAICGPVLELVVKAAAGHPGIDVIHVEVYANPKAVDTIAEASLAPAVEAWGFSFEPSLLVIDAAGTVVRRLDLIFDGDEIAEAFASVS